jgi:hypothetical protein
MGIKSEKNIYFTVPVSRKYSSEERKAIAQDIVDFVVNRTKKGVDKNGAPLPAFSGKNKTGKYSTGYANSVDFRAAGKSPSKLNLMLSGDMLAAMRELKNKSTSTLLAIGYSKSDPEAGRVEGNVLGTYGQSKPVTKGRDFLGISQKDLQKILKQYPLDDEEKRTERTEKVLGALEDVDNGS